MTYTLLYQMTDFIEVEVEADSLEEAIDKGYESREVMEYPLSDVGFVKYLPEEN